MVWHCYYIIMDGNDVIQAKHFTEQRFMIGPYCGKWFLIHRSVYILKWGKMSHILLFVWAALQFLMLVVSSIWVFLFKAISTGIFIFLPLFAKPMKHWASLEKHCLMLVPRPNWLHLMLFFDQCLSMPVRYCHRILNPWLKNLKETCPIDF